MAENYSAQNSITIKRLRSNDSLMLTFENNGIPLFQAVDEESGAVSPDWSIAPLDAEMQCGRPPHHPHLPR